jgi:hypothetical protein
VAAPPSVRSFVAAFICAILRHSAGPPSGLPPLCSLRSLRPPFPAIASFASISVHSRFRPSREGFEKNA